MQVGISGAPVNSPTSAFTGEARVWGRACRGKEGVAGINFAVSIMNVAPLALLLEFRQNQARTDWGSSRAAVRFTVRCDMGKGG